MKFTKDDLLYDYSWNVDGGDNPNYRGHLDKIKVDKTEGYEVLYFLNKFLVDYERPLNLANFRWAEKILKSNALKGIELRSELNAAINNRWTNHMIFEKEY